MEERQRYKFKKFMENPFFKRGDFYVKLMFTIFCLALYILIFILCDGVIYFENYIYASEYKGEPFQIHVIDVENGDAILIHLPNNETMMIDTGMGEYYNRVDSYIRQYFYFEKTNTIDYLFLTHCDADHIGNAKELIEEFDVKTLYRPKLYSLYEEENQLMDNIYDTSTSEIYSDVIETAYRKNIKLVFADCSLASLYINGCKIEFLGALSEHYSNDNNYSTIIKITYQTKSFLFMGDAESKVEKELISKYGDNLRADVLKVGHHGSNTSTSQEFLEVVKPTIAILSCSEYSSILPNRKVIERLKNMDIKIASTANEGNFVMRVHNDEIEFTKAERSSNYLALIFTIFMLIVFTAWQNPFSKIDWKYLNKNQINKRQ